MAEDLSKAAGLGQTVDIGGKPYEFRPLKMGDLAAFQKYLRDGRLDAIKRQNLPTTERQALRRSILKDPVSGDEMDAEMSTFDGCLFLLWRSLRKSMPAITLDEVGDLFSMKEVVDAMEVIRVISGFEDDDENPPEVPQETP